jgi:drug/metabolite transporter (DMT)-like permease
VSAVALALVLLSAACHAAWNYLVKREGATRRATAAFTWLFAGWSAVFLAPAAAWFFATGRARVGAGGLLLLAGSATIHTTYFLLLQRGYRSADLSLVYPLARGTGPLLASAAAVALLGEPLSAPAAVGALLVAGGAFVLAGGTRSARQPGSRAGVVNGLAVGALIGAYTVWDTHLVRHLAVPPLVVEWSISLAIALLVTPATLADRAQLEDTWRRHRGATLAGAVLSSASYVLFLTALGLAPVSRVAPAREVSIVAGAVLGTRLLAEPDAPRRVTASGLIALGVVLLAFA